MAQETTQPKLDTVAIGTNFFDGWSIGGESFKGVVVMELTCKICGALSISKQGEIEGYRADTYFDVMRCNTCECNFVLPCEPDDKVYEAIYKNVSVVPGYSRYLQYARQILKEKYPLNYLMNSEDCYWGIAQTVLTEINSKKTKSLIWEVGCGQGYFTYALVKSGFNAIGLDVSETAVNLANQRYGNYYFCEDAKKYFTRTKERPSIIILSEVVEHLADPVSFIMELMSYLEPDGALIITTPNKDSCRSGGIWETELPPVHLWWFTAKGLKAIGERLSCRTVFASFDKFYSNNLLFTAAAGTQVQQHLPTFDKKYSIIVRNSQASSAFISSLKSILKRLFPREMLRKIQLKNAKRNGLSEILASNPASLCVMYKAEKK